MDLESAETAVLTAMRGAGAALLSKLLKFSAPDKDQRTLPCDCGQQALFREVRSKGFLSILGATEVSRPLAQDIESALLFVPALPPRPDPG